VPAAAAVGLSKVGPGHPLARRRMQQTRLAPRNRLEVRRVTENGWWPRCPARRAPSS
jgi:hypothetical protein